MTTAGLMTAPTMPPSARVPSPLEIPSTSIANLAAMALGLYLAVQAMLANEFFRLPISILILTGLPVLFFWILAGDRWRFTQSSIVLPYLALLGWWWLCTLIGSLKGEYIGMALYGFRFHLTTFVFCGIAASFGLLRTVLTGYGIGFLGALAMCAKYGEIDVAGRFCIPGSTLENPNDLALHLLIGLSVLSVLAFDANLLKRLVWLMSFGLTLYFVLRTGSRANLLTLGAMLLIVFVSSKARARVLFLVSTILLGAILLVVIPKATWVRLTTFFTFSEQDYMENQQVANAASSTEARKELQTRAFKMTLQHPLFGVGPNMFLYALDDYMREQENRSKGTWLHSHNTYLDIAAETGVPGLVLYCVVVFWCVRTNFRGFQRAQREKPLAGYLGVATALLMASIAMGFGTLFCSVPYWSVFCYLVGLTAAGQLVLRDYDRRNWVPAPVPAHLKRFV